MSNSALVTYTKITKNKTSPRKGKIDTITIHCIVGQWTAKQGCDYFANTDRQASANYVVGKDGSIGLCVDEADRAWTSGGTDKNGNPIRVNGISGADNDHRAVTIEVASDTSAPYAVTDAAYNALIRLVADICKRNGIKQLLWKGDKSLVGKTDKQNMTVHRWFADKSCPGDYLYNRHGDIAAKVNAILGASGNAETVTGTQAADLKNLSDADAIKKVAPLFTADQKKSGILASVSLAQFILESGYGKSELAINANNCFGMKKNLSGNTWSGSSWDGKSIYTKQTKEQNPDGSYETITADFRKYPDIEHSIADHSAYLLGAMNGKVKRYEGLKDCKEYREAFQIIKNGGYATSLTYVDYLCSVVVKWNLTQYDVKEAEQVTAPSTASGDVVKTFPACPFTVRVIVDDLNIRKTPQMGENVVGVTGKNVFTILEVRNGWGRLKSGAGWIWLENPDYCTIQGTVQEAAPTTQKYTVKKGDSLWRIAKNLLGDGNRYKEIMKLSGITSEVIHVGQVLTCPVK